MHALVVMVSTSVQVWFRLLRALIATPTKCELPVMGCEIVLGAGRDRHALRLRHATAAALLNLAAFGHAGAING